MPQASYSEKPASWQELLSGKNGLTTLALTGGVALHAINIYIVTTILPTIVQEIGGIEYYSWNTTLFVITSIIGSVLAAPILAKIGPKYAYLLGLLLFLLGSVWCGFSANMPVLLVGRILQGFGGGILFALSYALIRILFEERLWSRAMGITSGMWGIATLIGPAIGGLFAQYGSWRWAFWSVVPVTLALAMIVKTHINSQQQILGKNSSIPFVQIILLAATVLILTLMSLTTALWLNILAVLAVLSCLVFIAKIDQRHKNNKLMPTGAYQLKHPIGLVFGLMILLIMGLATEVYVPYFLQVIQQLSPLMAGYLTAIMAAGWTLGAFVTANKKPAQVEKIFRTAPLMILISLIGLAMLMPLVGLMQSALLTVLFILSLIGVGLGIGLCWPHLAIIVFNSAHSGEESLASSAVVTVQLFAMALATAVAGIVVNHAGIATLGGQIGAQKAAFWLFSLFAIAPLFAIWMVFKLSKLRKNNTAVPVNTLIS